jgi:hypothetical protein
LLAVLGKEFGQLPFIGFTPVVQGVVPPTAALPGCLRPASCT